MGLTWSIAKIVSHLIEENGAWAAIQDFVPVFVASGAVKLVVTWLTDWAGVKASSTVKFQLRQKVLHALGKRPGSSSTMSVGETSALLLDGLDALDGYFGKYLPQLVQVAITTPALVLLFWTADPISALVLTVTIPLVPVFMILVGLKGEAVSFAVYSVDGKLIKSGQTSGEIQLEDLKKGNYILKIENQALPFVKL